MRIFIASVPVNMQVPAPEAPLSLMGKKKKCCKSYKDGKRCKDCPKKKK